MSMADRDGVIWYDGKLVPWRDEKPLGGVKFQLQVGAFIDVACTVDVHVSTGFGEVVRLVIL